MIRKVLTAALVAMLAIAAGAFTTPATAADQSNEPTLTIGDAHVTEPAEPGATATARFRVTLDRPTARGVRFHYETRNGNAISRSGAQDYFATSGATGIAPGQTSTEITVRVVGDRQPEGIESFRLKLSHVGGAKPNRFDGFGYINPPYSLTVGKAAVVEPRPGMIGAAKVTVRLGTPLRVPVRFGWYAAPQAMEGTVAASSHTDFVPTVAYSTIPAGRTSVDLYVLTRGDAQKEPPKTIAVHIDPRSTGVPVLPGGGILILDNALAKTDAPGPLPPAPIAAPGRPIAPSAPSTPAPTTPRPTAPPSTAAPTTAAPTTTTPPTTQAPAPPAPPRPAAPAPVLAPRMASIGDYASMPGDRVVVVPNGVYRGATVTTTHPATNGPYKGWLVLVAQSEHGAVIDLNDVPLELTSSASRIMFVGFRFIRGSVFVEGNDINFWYTDHTFPADAWVAQAPSRSAPENGRYRAPRTVYVRDGAQRVRFYGSDLHDTSTALISQKNEDLLLQGVNIWNLGDMGLDPNDVTHPDAIGAVAGGTTRMTVLDSWVRGRIMLQDESNGNGAPHRDFLFQHTWVSDSPSSGFTFISSKSSQPWGVFGVRNDVWSWGHNNGKDRIDFLDGQQRFDFNVRPERINVRDTNVHASAPPAGSVSPSDAWRNAHPFGSWAEVLDGL